MEIFVPFLQAAFCLKGFDDRSRFFATSTIALLGFIFCSAIFSAYLAISFIILLLLTTVLTLSTKRRLHDAKLNKNWQLVPGALFLLTGGLCLFIESSSSYYLLILPALSTALLLTYPSKGEDSIGKYILGYHGPIDLSAYLHEANASKTHNQRVEPTMAANYTSEQHHHNEIINEPINEQTITPLPSPDNKQIDIGELIRLKFLNNRKLQLGLIASISLVILAVFITSLSTSINEPDNSTAVADLNKSNLLNKNASMNVMANKAHLLAMPDNFNLYLSDYQGVIVHWQADLIADGELWSLSTATGDKSCQTIKFNKGAPLRPLSVLVENGSDYFARFSPLDSKELIRALAFRGKFSLCGYSFSLKGSQAVLGKNTNYAPFLDNDA